MEFWLEYVSSFVSARLITLIVIITSSLVVTLVLHVVFVEYLIKNYLSEQYGMFRRMHEYMIPEFLINKEKIIKAKLIK